MLPLLIALLATAAHGQFLPSASPDSLNVERVGEITLVDEPLPDRFGNGADLWVAGDIALMGDFRGIVHIVDIADPTAMRKIAEVRTPGPALDVKIAGDIAAIGVQQRSTDFGLILLDLSDPANPVELSRLVEDGWNGVHNLFIHRDRVYLAHAGSPGMRIVDISDPTAPFVSGFWGSDALDNVVHDVFVHDDLAFVSHIAPDNGGLSILDLADPDAPVTLASLPIAEGIHAAWAEGDYVYCSAEFGGWQRRLYVVDIADPRRPRIVRPFGVRPPHDDAFIGPHNPIVRDGLLYWAYYDGGFRVFDLLDPARPVEIGYHSYPGFAWSAQPHDDGLVYVADSSVGIEAFRLREPAFAIGSVALNPPVAVRGRHQSIGIKTTAIPSPRGGEGRVEQVSARLNTHAAEPLVAEGAVYTGSLSLPSDLPTGRHRLRVALTDDRGRVYPFERTYDLYPERDLPIFAAGIAEGWLRSGNVPRQTTTFAGRRALTLPERFSTTFRVRTPFDPTGYRALRLAVHPDAVEEFATNVLAVTVESHTVRLSFNASDSLAISLPDKRWQTVEIPLDLFGLADTGLPLAFTSVRISGQLKGTAHIADVSLVAAVPPANTAVREERNESLPATFSLAQNFPNPFNAATTIRFALTTDDDIDLALYNLAGQRVATLVSGPRPPGAYTLTWDGRDDSGHALASGLYLYRLRAGHQSETRKLTLLR